MKERGYKEEEAGFGKEKGHGEVGFIFGEN